MPNLRLAPLLGLFTGLCLLGCSDPYPGRNEVTGKVTVKGAPFKNECSISFEPLDGQDTRGGISFVGGEFSLPRDQGLKAGNYLVRLTAGDGKTPNDEDAGGPGGSTNIVSVDLIPEDYGLRSKQQFAVKNGGPNRLEIDLPNLVEPKIRKKR